jgi:hypothetical protein
MGSAVNGGESLTTFLPVIPEMFERKLIFRDASF